MSAHEELFDTWTEQSAYILGFLWADGCLYNNTMKNEWTINFYSNDQDIIEKIRDGISPGHKIYTRMNSSGKSSYRLILGNKRLVARLLELGMTPRKSKTIAMPEVPKEWVRHFIRGYFDGNGHVTTYNHQGKKTRLLQSGFTAGSLALLSGLSDSLHSLGLRKAPLQHHRNKWGTAYSLQFFTHDSERLYHVMYDGATIFMDRKKAAFDHAFALRDGGE